MDSREREREREGGGGGRGRERETETEKRYMPVSVHNLFKPNTTIAHKKYDNCSHLEKQDGDDSDDDGDDAREDGGVEEHLVQEEAGEEGDRVDHVDDGDDDDAREKTRDGPHEEAGVLSIAVEGLVHVVDGGEDAADAVLGDRLQQVLVGAGAVGAQHRVEGRGGGPGDGRRLVHVRETSAARRRQALEVAGGQIWRRCRGG